MATVLRAGVIYGYFFEAAFRELAYDVCDCSRKSPISFNPASIKPLHRPSTHATGNHSVNLFAH
ncbi:MAG TPA: hypothetical protein VMD04_02695 [Candidatus Margulisiibacteriota bacterium]|nr:hypothetical protein [Candidatus Margulisiibacteriota bacterium]